MIRKRLLLFSGVCIGTFALIEAALAAPVMRRPATEIDRSSETRGVGQETERTVWDGVYTEQQAERGEQSYKRSCGHCHRDNLRGDDRAAPLIDSAFTDRWRDVTVADLFLTVQTRMPFDAPSSLVPQTIIDIISFVLKKNEMPVGDTELPPDVEKLEHILITEKPSKP